MPQKQVKAKSSNRRGFLQHAGLVASLATATAGIAIAQAPQAQLENGVLRVTVQLPDASKGFYRGTRFDWSGTITDLTFAGHTYCGPWFTKSDPDVHDYIVSPSGIIAGKASADSGPVEDFSPLGFDQAKPSGTFVKLGVGVLRKPDGKEYDFARDYPMIDPGAWNVHATKTSVEFTQKIVDPGSGYGYLYTKTIRLVPGQPRMAIEHTLKNLGRLPIATDVYDHNFTAIDHLPIGPDYSIALPSPIKLDHPLDPARAAVDGNRIVFRKSFVDHDVIDVHSTFKPPQTANDIHVENSRAKAGVRITGDQPLQVFEVWAIRQVMGIEPWIHLSAAPGETIHWTYNYSYYTLP